MKFTDRTIKGAQDALIFVYALALNCALAFVLALLFSLYWSTR